MPPPKSPRQQVSEIAALLAGTAILGYQLGSWLATAQWPTVGLDVILGCLRDIGPGWIGLQKIWDWLLAFPLFVAFYLAGFIVFWLLGLLSAALYRNAAYAAALTVTPSQSHT
jgi:hypothetical protein